MPNLELSLEDVNQNNRILHLQEIYMVLTAWSNRLKAKQLKSFYDDLQKQRDIKHGKVLFFNQRFIANQKDKQKKIFTALSSNFAAYKQANSNISIPGFATFIQNQISALREEVVRQEFDYQSINQWMLFTTHFVLDNFYFSLGRLTVGAGSEFLLRHQLKNIKPHIMEIVGNVLGGFLLLYDLHGNQGKGAFLSIIPQCLQFVFGHFNWALNLCLCFNRDEKLVVTYLPKIQKLTSFFVNLLVNLAMFYMIGFDNPIFLMMAGSFVMLAQLLKNTLEKYAASSVDKPKSASRELIYYAQNRVGFSIGMMALAFVYSNFTNTAPLEPEIDYCQQAAALNKPLCLPAPEPHTPAPRIPEPPVSLQMSPSASSPESYVPWFR